MSDRIRRPVFNGSPLDDLAVVDVYKETTSAVRNNFVSSYSAFSTSLADTIGTQRAGLGSLFSDVQNGEVGLKTGLDRVTGLLKGARGDLNKLTSDFKTRINDVVENNPAMVIKANFDNLRSTIRNGDLDSIEGISNMLTDVTGNNLFSRIDIGAEVALLTGILEEIDSWEVPEFIDSVMEKLGKNGDGEVGRLAVEMSAARISLNGDIDSVEQLLKHVPAATLTKNVPDFAERLLTRYQFKYGETPSDWPRRFEQLVRILDQLQPNWLYITRRGQQVYNLSVMQSASPDAQTLLSTSDEHRVAVLTAPNYVVRDARSIMREMYPLIPLAS